MPGGPPLRVGNALSDFMGGIYTAYGILAALHYKTKTGLGQYIDDALADNIMAMLENVVPNYDLMGTIPIRDGSRIAWVAPYNCYQATDGYLTIGATTNVLFHRFCRVIGREDLIGHPDFIDPSARVKNVDKVDEVVQEWVGTKTVKEVVDLLAENAIPCSKVNTVVDLVTDPHIKAREMFVEVEYPEVGKFRVAGVTPKLSLTPGKVETPPPTIGQHNDEIYRGLLKLSDEKIEDLTEKGVI
jgi:crotonobetainyl-CoA:carnitine CoA-transferase CaiB-like acyl-CoA transferase